MKKPQLVAPAGNLEKLKIAVLYGADAAYLSGERFGLRASADNLSSEDLTEGVAFAHSHQCLVYVTLNAVMHDKDIKGLRKWCLFLEEIGVDAVIVSDLGVARIVRSCCGIPLHLSTQASCLNSLSARAWKSHGIQRVIVGRELSITEAEELQRKAQIEVEMFVHGSMCMGYSGRCTISNYTAARDANRGGCIHSCRFGYTQGARNGTRSKREIVRSSKHFMSSKDLLGLFQIPGFFEAGISALKIEGRMKSALYVAAVSSAYRRAIDSFAQGLWNEALAGEILEILECAPHRDYTEGFLVDPTGIDSIYEENKNTILNASHDMLGVILESDERQLVVKNNQALHKGDTIELLGAQGKRYPLKLTTLRNAVGHEVNMVRQESIAILPPISQAFPFQLIVRPSKYGQPDSIIASAGGANAY